MIDDPRLLSFMYIQNYLGLEPSIYYLYNEGLLKIKHSNSCWYSPEWFIDKDSLHSDGQKTMYLFLLKNLECEPYYKNKILNKYA